MTSSWFFIPQAPHLYVQRSAHNERTAKLVFSKFDTESFLQSPGRAFLLQLVQSAVEGLHACLSFQPELATYLSERNGLDKKTATHFVTFYIHGSVHRESNLITVQQDATYSVYYISEGSSTCFGC